MHGTTPAARWRNARNTCVGRPERRARFFVLFLVLPPNLSTWALDKLWSAPRDGTVGLPHFRVARDPSIVSPSLTGVFRGGVITNTVHTGSRCTLPKQCRPPSPRRRWRCDRSSPLTYELPALVSSQGLAVHEQARPTSGVGITSPESKQVGSGSFTARKVKQAHLSLNNEF